MPTGAPWSGLTMGVFHEGDAKVLLGQEPWAVPVLPLLVTGAQGGQGAYGRGSITFSQPHLSTF